MTVQIKPWGNSSGIRISRELLRESGLELNVDLEVTAENGRIIIEKPHRRLSLEERMEKYGPIIPGSEIDWGDPVGNEFW